jgi:RND superfamily putative drug exporter
VDDRPPRLIDRPSRTGASTERLVSGGSVGSDGGRDAECFGPTTALLLVGAGENEGGADQMSRSEPDTSPERLAPHQRLSTGLLAGFARACTTHPWRVVAAWMGIFAVLGVLVATVGGGLRDEFTIPGSDSQRGTDLIESKFVSEQGSVLNIVFAVPEGQRLDTPGRRAAIEEAVASLRTAEFKPTAGGAGIESVSDPFSRNTFAKNGRIAYAEARFDRPIYSKDRDAVVAVEDAVRKDVASAGVTVEYNGEAEAPPIEQGPQELLGLLAALIVLLVVFRTFTALVIPIALAITALVAAFLLLFTLAGLTDFNTITPLLVSMIGLGVGIDYSLFIVTRFRQLLHDGLSPRDAAAEAGASAGRAVLFAGLTVAISVTGLAFFGLDFVTKLGIGSALGVLTTVLIATSLLPAVLAKLGHRVDRLKVPFLRAIDESEAARERTLVARWGRFVTRNARFVFPVVALVIVGLGATSMLVRLGASDQGTAPKKETARRAYDLLAEGFGSGFNGPIPIVVAVNGDRQAPERIYERVKGFPDVASVRQPVFNDARTVALVYVTPDSAPQDAATDTLVNRLRDDVVPEATAGGNAAAYVSGQTAAFKDIADRIMQRLPFFLLYIIGVTFIVLAMAFRSIVISLTAAVTTILSGFVGFGVLTLVFQEGYLLSLTGLDRTGPIETFVPPIAFAILFGLSMDYMVFLMSRIREEHVNGLGTREAVEHGIAAVGRVVVAAALIMGTVFSAFVLTPDRITKEFGVLLAVAILTDALIVRMTLVPAFFTLLGEKTWYMPRWLDRLLPKITIEPPHNGEVRRPAGPQRRPEPGPSKA